MLAQSKHGRCDISTLDSRARPYTHHLARSRQISKELFSAVEGGGAFLTVGDGPPTKIRPSSVCTCTPSPICLPPRKLLPAPYASFLHPTLHPCTLRFIPAPYASFLHPTLHSCTLAAAHTRGGRHCTLDQHALLLPSRDIHQCFRSISIDIHS